MSRDLPTLRGPCIGELPLLADTCAAIGISRQAAHERWGKITS